jgi:dihydropteroate synthase
MGILNLTPDSFYDGGRFTGIDRQLVQVEKMLLDGASIIDLGAVSTRPGAEEVCQTGEMERLLPAIRAIRLRFPECILSVDTFRPLVARAMVGYGADMINDIYAGRFEEGMFETIASLDVPYVMMHMKGDPGTMQVNPHYSDVVAEVIYFFEQQTARARMSGVNQVIVDPGFGFGKSDEHNYRLLSALDMFRSLGYPVMAGLSRKSMINRVLKTKPEEALNGTTVLNTIALLKGADILRVHDVKEAVETIKLVSLLT